MFLFTYTAAVLTILCLGFAAFLFRVKSRNLTARLMAAVVSAVAVWVGSNAFADVSTTVPNLVFWSGMAFIGVAFFVSLYLCFVHAFLYGRWPGPARLIAIFGPTAFFTPLAFSRLSVADTYFPPDLPAQIAPGPLYWPIFAFLLVGLLIGFFQLLRRYGAPRTSPRERMQILYMETGFVVVFVCSILFGIVLPFLGELRFYSVGPQSALVLIVCCGYAILRHQLLDIKIVVQKGVIYSLAISLFAGFYLLVLFFLSAWTGSARYLAASFITTLVGIFGMGPLLAFFQQVTDPIFFKNRYRYPEAMETLSHILNRQINLEPLLVETAAALRGILKAETVEFLKEPAAIPPIDALDVPVILDRERIGILRLGPKRSGDPYARQDLSLLKSFSYQFAVAVEKARLYQEAKAHSEQLEEKVRSRTAEIRHMHETQAQMMVDISHNLQTPLTVLKGQLGTLRGQGHNVDRLEKSVDMVSDFIVRLLKLASLSHADEEGERVIVDFSALLEDIVSYFAVTAEMQGITIEANIEKGLRVRGHEKRLQDLVLNILDNAAKYIAEPKRIRIALARLGSDARLSVRDTGVGIPVEALPTLFTRFRRGAGASGTGSGLGLAISRKIVELHHGTIAVESAPGQGTTVAITLPLCASC